MWIQYLLIRRYSVYFLTNSRFSDRRYSKSFANVIFGINDRMRISNQFLVYGNTIILPYGITVTWCSRACALTFSFEILKTSGFWICNNILLFFNAKLCVFSTDIYHKRFLTWYSFCGVFSATKVCQNRLNVSMIFCSRWGWQDS